MHARHVCRPGSRLPGRRRQRTASHTTPPHNDTTQVPGCNLDLTEERSYNQRHKICAQHVAADAIPVVAAELRVPAKLQKRRRAALQRALQQQQAAGGAAPASAGAGDVQLEQQGGDAAAADGGSDAAGEPQLQPGSDSAAADAGSLQAAAAGGDLQDACGDAAAADAGAGDDGDSGREEAAAQQPDGSDQQQQEQQQPAPGQGMIDVRWCQQCGRLEQVAAFDGSRRCACSLSGVVWLAELLNA